MIYRSEESDKENNCEYGDIDIPYTTLKITNYNWWDDNYTDYPLFEEYAKSTYFLIDDYNPQYSVEWDDYKRYQCNSTLYFIVKNNKVISLLYDESTSLQSGDGSTKVYRIEDDILICNCGDVASVVFIKNIKLSQQLNLATLLVYTYLK